jgi:hypothetical protein
MLNITKSISVSGTSSIEENGKNIAVVYLSANISDDGSTSIVQTINNKELYIANKEICEADCLSS